MAEQTLPPVAKSVYTDCKKCGSERYHIVLAHTSSTSAKVECETCHSKKTYKISTAMKRMITGERKVSKGTSARSVSARAAAHEAEYQQMLQDTLTGETLNYNMKLKFVSGQRVQHPKFGLGIVKQIFAEKVDIVFQDEVKSLVHNRI